MAASGTLVTALVWETSDTESPTRAKYQANWNAMDLHVHDNRGAGGGVWALQTAHAPVQSGDIQIAGDLLKWWGQSASAVKTAVDTDSAQTLTNKTLGASCTVSTTVAVTSGGTGLTTATTAYGVVCAGTTPTGNFQVLASLGTAGQLLQSNGTDALPSWTTGTLAGDVTGSIGANTIAAGVVTGTKIAAGTITATNLTAGTITPDKFSPVHETAFLGVLTGPINADQDVLALDTVIGGVYEVSASCICINTGTGSTATVALRDAAAGAGTALGPGAMSATTTCGFVWPTFTFTAGTLGVWMHVHNSLGDTNLYAKPNGALSGTGGMTLPTMMSVRRIG